MTDRQKAAVKKVSDDSNTRRGAVFQELRQQADMAKAQAAQEAQAQALARMPESTRPSIPATLASAIQLAPGRQPGDPARQVDPAQQQQAAQFQGQQAGNAAQAQGWQMMREAMQQLQHETDGQLARVLDKTQFKRLHEIQLQAEGPGAVLREDVAEKLEINEEQHAEIQGILQEAGKARREVMRKNFQFMRSLMPHPRRRESAGPGGPAADAAAAAEDGGQPAAGAAAPGGPGRRTRWTGRTRRNGQAQGQGGAWWPRIALDSTRPRWQKVMEKPEVKAKMEETQKEQKQLRDREYAMVYKAMDRRQVSAFKKMLGKPFDVDSLMGRLFRGGPGGRDVMAPMATPTRPRTRPRPLRPSRHAAAKADTKRDHDHQAGHDPATPKPAGTPRPRRTAPARTRIRRTELRVRSCVPD